MRALSHLFARVPYVGKPLWAALCFCLLISVVVSVHEFGHLLVALAFGLPVQAYSIGFGPELFGFDAGGIHWQLSSIPLGGYVSVDSAAVLAAPLWMKLTMLAAGPAINLAYLFGVMALLRRYADKTKYTFDLHFGGVLVWPFIVNAARAGSNGFVPLLWYTAVVSLDLAIFNILPIFPLDGGQMFMYTVTSFVDVGEATMAVVLIGIFISFWLLGRIHSPAGRRLFGWLYRWLNVPNSPFDARPKQREDDTL